MSPTPDAQRETEDSTRMKKTRFDKRYDPVDGTLTSAVIEIGDERGRYRLEFEHVSHGRLEFERISKADGTGWDEIDAGTLAEIHEALRVAGRAAQDDRLGAVTPLSGTTIASDVDLYDDIDPEGYVQPAETEGEDVVAEGSD